MAWFDGEVLPATELPAGQPEIPAPRLLLPLREYAVQEVAGLFDQLRDPLYRYFLCLGLSHDDAGDGVQETFLRLHQHLRRHGDSTNLRGWIFQVARNLVRNQIKRAGRQRTEALDEVIARQASGGDPVGSPEEQVLRRERLLRLQRAIAKLTPPQRECLRLRASGLRYREIAEVMGIGISSVGELVQRATGRLREGAE